MECISLPLTVYKTQENMFRIGIIGAGWIARKMAVAIAPSKEMEIYAISSRSITKAEAFAREFGIPAAYGSYEEMTRDPEVDLVYIATPPSHHFEHAMLALENGKPVLVEKAFTANADQASRLIDEARKRTRTYDNIIKTMIRK